MANKNHQFSIVICMKTHWMINGHTYEHTLVSFYFHKILNWIKCVETYGEFIWGNELNLNLANHLFGHIMLYTNLHECMRSNLKKLDIFSSFTDCCLLHLTWVTTMIVDLLCCILLLMLQLLRLLMRLVRRSTRRCSQCWCCEC